MHHHQDLPDRDGARALVESLTSLPAFAIDRHLTVFAANELAVAVARCFAVGVNLPRSIFLVSSPDHVDAVAGLACVHVSTALKASLDRFGEDEEFIEIIGELAALCMPFNVVWAQDSPVADADIFRFPVPGVGTIELTYDRRFVSDSSGDSVVTWRPADPVALQRLERISPGCGPTTP